MNKETGYLTLASTIVGILAGLVAVYSFVSGRSSLQPPAHTTDGATEIASRPSTDPTPHSASKVDNQQTTASSPTPSNGDIRISGPDSIDVSVSRCSLETIFFSLPRSSNRSLLISNGMATQLIDRYLKDAKKRRLLVDLAALRIFFFTSHDHRIESFRVEDVRRGPWTAKPTRDILQWYFRETWVEQVPNAEDAAAKLRADVICGD